MFQDDSDCGIESEEQDDSNSGIEAEEQDDSDGEDDSNSGIESEEQDNSDGDEDSDSGMKRKHRTMLMNILDFLDRYPYKSKEMVINLLIEQFVTFLVSFSSLLLL